LSKRAVSGIVLALLTVSLFAFTLNIQSVKASNTIYIRADGSIDPPTANITSLDNITYTFTDNIYDSIVVERDNIVIDGNGYTNTGSGTGNGLDLSSRSNVTVKNAKIESFDIGIYLFNSSMHACGIELNENTIANNTQIGIYLEYSSNNTITRNNVTNNGDGMGFLSSFMNTVSKNNITNNNYGVFLCKSSYNTLSSNNIADNYEAGFGFDLSFYNNITKNNIADNAYGVKFLSYSENNTFLHNSFIDNIQPVYLISPHVPPIANFWNNSYPIGNFWNDYEKRYPEAKDAYRGPYQNETGSDGIWDYPYIIDEYNIDNYPIVPEFPSLVILQLFMIATLLAVIVYKRKHSR
jgi:parallel beta-helix repeat protein